VFSPGGVRASPAIARSDQGQSQDLSTGHDPDIAKALTLLGG